MRSKLLPDDLWAEVRPLLPPPKRRRRRYPGRRPLDDRTILTGILFVLKTGIPWDDVPCELGLGSGKTMKRRLKKWTRLGVWTRLLGVMHAKLNAAGRLDLSNALVDSASVKAPGGGKETGPNPTDRRKRGSKHHVVTDAWGVPLAVITTAANRHDVTQLIPLIDAIIPIRGRVGRPRRRPLVVQGDRAYDSSSHRHSLKRRRIRPLIARRKTEHGSGLGKTRWPVERTLAWLHKKLKIAVRRERCVKQHHALVVLACALICWSMLK